MMETVIQLNGQAKFALSMRDAEPDTDVDIEVEGLVLIEGGDGAVIVEVVGEAWLGIEAELRGEAVLGASSTA